jgi:hypothetical protein
MSTESDLAQLRDRLDGLERRCGRLRREAWLWRFGCLVALVAVGYLIALETGYRSLPAPKTVECDTVNARWITVTDDAGKRRILLGVTDQGIASQSFWSPDEQLLAVIGTNEKGGVATFLSRTDKSNVWTGFYTTGQPGIHIRDGKEVVRAQLILQPNGSTLTLQDENGHVTFSKP